MRPGAATLRVWRALPARCGRFALAWFAVALGLSVAASAQTAPVTNSKSTPSGASLPAEKLAARVVLLANADEPDSLRIARHYAEVRHVPTENIIALKLPLAETIGWHEFIATVWEPLEAELLRQKWIDAIPMAATDSLGRHKFAFESHRIAALVVCRGVPLRIENDPTLIVPTDPFANRGEFRTNCSCVDAELSLLAQPNYPITAFVPNPLFQNDRPPSPERVVKVSRLDGPSVADAMALVDHAVEAERTGLLGRAYVDMGGVHPDGDQWLYATSTQIDDLDFELTVDRDPATIPANARCDAPVLYFGWYNTSLNGPFALPGFRFPPGAIALHIHSFSATTLRSPRDGWTGPLVSRGVTATVGNVYEPYLQLTHRPQLLLRALARGANLVDAAYFALPALSWQEVLIGDPLYRPFAVSLDEQLAHLDKLPRGLADYAVLRRLRALDRLGRGDEAIALARKTQHDNPSLALGLALSRRLHDAGDDDSAASALGFVAMLKTYNADEWGLVREIALQLQSCGHPARAVELWRTLFDNTAPPPELRLTWVPEAIEAARAAKDLEQAELWEHFRVRPAEKK